MSTFFSGWRPNPRNHRRSAFAIENLENRVLLSATNYGPKSALANHNADGQGDQENEDQCDVNLEVCSQDVDQTAEHDEGCNCAQCRGVDDENHDGHDHGHGGLEADLPREPSELVTVPETDPVQADNVDLSQTFNLHSLPNANHTIYLDFDGHVTTGTTWNSQSGINSIDSPAYDPSGNGAAFSDAELLRIQRIWQRVAEDFAPFEVNVTTEDPGAEALSKSGQNDTQWGVRVVITPEDWDNCGCGGFAYIGSFNDAVDEPVFVFNTSEIGVSAAISHEVGHAIGLSHDGLSGVEYYGGHGSGETSWGPIMGSGYTTNLTTWDIGQYNGTSNGGSGANYGSGADDFAVIISQNGFGYRADDHSSSFGAGTELEVVSEDVNSKTVQGFGRIETGADTDWFSFTAGDGTVDLTIDSYFVEAFVKEMNGSFTQNYLSSDFTQGSNLDVQARLYSSNGVLIATSNPSNELNARLQADVLEGTYYVEVAGVGFSSWFTNPPTGYEDVVSVGQFMVNGTVPVGAGDLNARPTLDAIAPLTLPVNAGLTTVTLTGISAGAGEDQPVRIMAVSDNPGLIPNPSVTYNDGDSTAELSFTPVADQFGMATITVTVEDAGPDLDFNTTEDNRSLTRILQIVVEEPVGNSAPDVSDQTFGVIRRSSDGTVVGTIVATDVDQGDTLTYEIVSATDFRAFSIDPETGEITVARRRSIRSTGTHELVVRVTDDGDPSQSTEATITINVVDSNTAGTVVIEPVEVSVTENEDRAERLLVANLEVVDEGVGTNNLGLAGADAGLFEIDGNQLFLLAGPGFDFETMSQLDVTVTVDDPTISGAVDNSTDFSLAVLDVNEAATDVFLENKVDSVPENLDTSTPTFMADIVVVDDALGEHQITLSGPDGDLFMVLGTQLFLKPGVTLDFASNPSLDVQIDVDDLGVGTDIDAQNSYSFEVTEVSVNTAPVIEDQEFAVERRSSSGTFVGQVIATDADAGQQLTYEIVSGDDDAFSIDSETGELTVRRRRAVRNAGEYTIVVRVTDDGDPSLWSEATITVNVF